MLISKSYVNVENLTSDFVGSGLSDIQSFSCDTTTSPITITISEEDIQSGTLDTYRIMTIFDKYGTSATNNIIIQLGNGGTINGQPTFFIDSNYTSLNLYCDGSNAIAEIIKSEDGGSTTLSTEHISGGVVQNVTGDTSGHYILYNGAAFGSNKISMYMDGVDNYAIFYPKGYVNKSGFTFIITLAFYRDIGSTEGISSLNHDTVENFIFRRNSAGQLAIWLSSNGTSFDIANGISGTKTDWITDNTYNFKIHHTGTQWEVSWSEDNKNWDDITKTWYNEFSIINSSKLYQYTDSPAYTIGGDVYTTNYWFKGSVKLKDTLMFTDETVLLQPQTRDNFQKGIIVPDCKARSQNDLVDIYTSNIEIDTSDDLSWASGECAITQADQFPAMTGDSAPSPDMCWATSRFSSTYPVYKAFNKTASSNTDCWLTTDGVTTGTLLRAMTSEYEIDMIQWQPRYDTTNHTYPTDFTFVYTEDDMSIYTAGVDADITNINYITVKTVFGNSQFYQETKSFKLDTPIPPTATAWGMIVTRCNLTGGSYIGISMMEGINTKARNYGICVWADYNSSSPRVVLDDKYGSNILGEKRMIGKTISDTDGLILQGVSTELAGGSVETMYKTTVTEEYGTDTNWYRGLTNVSVPPNTKAYCILGSQAHNSSYWGNRFQLNSWNNKDVFFDEGGGADAVQRMFTECWVNDVSELYRYINTQANCSWEWGVYGFTDPRIGDTNESS